MLRFTVYDQHGSASAWPLNAAHLIGPEDLAVPGKIKFRKGAIYCQKSGSQAVGLCLQYDSGKSGVLILQTCLLPDRDKPYILSVELARHRIKMFIAKCEEWQMLDLATDHRAMLRWDEARQIFTEAITCEDPVEADRLGRRALSLALDASDRLAMTHAEILLHRRYANRPASSAVLGVRVWPKRHDQSLFDVVERNFDLIVLPLNWRYLEIEEGRYNWDPLDRWMDWASKQHKPIVAGPLLDFSKNAVPNWMYVWQHDYDTTRDFAYDHVGRVVQRYRSVVGMWNIASGINVNDNFKFTSEQMLDLIRMTVLQVRQLRKGARTMVELKQPFGEHCALSNKSLSPVSFLESLIHEGIRLDAIGLQVLLGVNKLGRATRDLMQLSSMLDRFLHLDLPVLISAMGAPSSQEDEDGGYLREPWSPQIQSRWVARMFAIAMSKPFIESVFWADLYDHPDSDVPAVAMIDESGKPKQALSRLVGIRKRLRKPLGLRQKAITQIDSPTS